MIIMANLFTSYILIIVENRHFVNNSEAAYRKPKKITALGLQALCEKVMLSAMRSKKKVKEKIIMIKKPHKISQPFNQMFEMWSSATVINGLNRNCG